MHVQITTVSPVSFEAEFELPQDELQPHFDRAYEKFRPKAELKGFRKGKVPLAMVRKIYGESIERDALEDIAGDVYRDAMKERDIQPIGRPTMTDLDFKRGETFRFKIAYEVKPQIQLKNYRGLTVDRFVHPVTDEDVQEEIDHLRRANGTPSPADMVADDEHVVIADVQELDATGTPLIGRKSENVRFVLSDTSLAAEIRGALRNAKTGDACRVDLPGGGNEQHPPRSLSLEVKAIEKVTLPEFDEALVQKITKNTTSTPAEFRDRLRNDLERYWEDQGTSRLANDIASEVVRMHEFVVPPTLVNAFLDSFVEEVRGQSRDRKLPEGFDETKFRESNRASAVWQAKWTILKEQIVVVEKITVSETDLEQLAATDAARMGIGADRLLQYYKKSESVSDRLLNDKVIAFLRENAKITDRPVDQHAHVH